MPFPPERNHRISLEQAEAMTRRYREHAGPKAVRASLFPRKVFEELLAQPGCAGIRIYYGQLEDGQLEPMLVGVNEEGNDLTKGMLMNVSFPCPPYCEDDSALNR